MTVDFQRTIRSELLARGVENATDDAMFVPRFGRQVGGIDLGYRRSVGSCPMT